MILKATILYPLEIYRIIKVSTLTYIKIMLKKSDVEKERINDDIVFEIELIKQVEVNIDIF